MKCTLFSSKWEKSVLPWAFKLNGVTAAAETWDLMTYATDLTFK
jgi:hypothetical protein